MAGANADSNALLAFFTQMDDQGGVIVRDIPKLDLDLYIQNYEGMCSSPFSPSQPSFS
ncbi:hypothetical protein CH063_14723 [Colletotrichum higginsianum]|uniref:Uncharacterized protein n=1 Tax=Colletotrichum higginsianum (strain IMI 349063) TaxID=759273 RepID=H1VZU5_COLHI|nr:hypothetical protein CH063_14723 [Colletotrichum higginsianum]